MKCGFEDWKPCDEDCEYFHTCTRNPRYDELRKGNKSNGRKKNVHKENKQQ